jgi:chromate transporter
MHTLLQLAALLAKLSLLAVGGSGTTLGQMQHEVVRHGWMTAGQFSSAYGLSQGLPGPGTLIALPVGYGAAGTLGGIIAMAAYFLPTSLFAIVVAAIWQRCRSGRWPQLVRTALMPVALGVLLASALTLGSSGATTVSGMVILAGVTAVILRTSLPVPVVIGAAMTAGAALIR